MDDILAGDHSPQEVELAVSDGPIFDLSPGLWGGRIDLGPVICQGGLLPASTSVSLALQSLGGGFNLLVMPHTSVR